MSVDSSSASNATLPPSPLSSSINMYSDIRKCFISPVGTFSITAFTIISILLLLPVCILVLYLGLQRWRQQRSGTMMSHSDLITCHMIVTELMSVFGSTLTCCGVHTDLPKMTIAGLYFLIMKLFGQMFFHSLTCVERYLAVVHPITYLNLKETKGIRIRNISIGCVWLLCFAWTGIMFKLDLVLIDNLYFCSVAFAIFVTSVCSLSVLHVLIRPGPGEGGGDRQRVDQSKLRAFYTIMAILGVLLFRFVGNILATALSWSPQLGADERCGLRLSVIWWSLPSSLVLPLLFLQRAGKLVCCKKNNTSGQGSD